ncbi:hypothetical protein BGX20_009940 [Mortierella sp. AD010]|nr:hypothetical protein BGX20_009940 [Mortierella sp. AD010]
MSHGVRSFITPADPMAAAYSGMVNSLWSVGSAVVDVVATTTHFGSDKHGAATTTAEGQVLKPGVSSAARDRDSFHGAWDGTGTILSDSSPRERQLYLQAQLKAPIFPMDLYYLLYLLDRFELEGINIDGWDGSTPRAVGDSKPRVLNNGTGLPDPSTYSSFPPPSTARPQSIRSFSSTALSTLTLITGWKQWSTAASSSSSNNAMTITDDVHFIHKFLKKITGLRLVSKIPPGFDIPVKGRIEGYSGEGISSLLRVLQPDQDSIIFRQSPPPQLLLPLGATFSSLTHLELHKIPPRSIDGWECLMPQLKSLVVIQSGIEDVHDVIVTAVVESERRRRERVSKEKNRAVLIRQEQREALKDATMTPRSRRMGQGSTSSTSSQSPESSQASSPSSLSQSGGTMFGSDFANDDDLAILNSIKMWPVLRHLSVSDNALAVLQNDDTFSYTQAIVTLDLSNNLLVSPPPNLIHLHNLHNLNLSYNLMTNVQSIYQILGNVTELDLRGNRLESLCGLERLWNLEKVDVRENNLVEAAEIGRLAALPGIREVWSEMNPFCTTQPKYRLEILAVFKANGHDLLLDGTFASFIEKRTLANMSPASFSTTISSIVNLANIPAASVPSAVLAKELASPPPRITRPDTATTGSGASSSERADSTDRRSSSTRSRDDSLIATPPPGSRPSLQPQKLVKKKLVKSSKRVKRIVNLDSDHEHDEDGNSIEEEYGDEQSHDHHHHHHHHHHEDTAYSKVLGPPVTIGKKKVIKKKSATTESGVGATTTEGGAEEKKTKKKVVKKKKKNQGPVSFTNNNNDNDDENNINNTNNSNNNTAAAAGNGDDDETSCLDKHCKDNRHVHRLALLEESMNGIQLHNNTSSNSNHNHSTRHSYHDSRLHNNDHGHNHSHHSHHHDNDSNSHGSIHHRYGDNNSLRAPSPSLDYSSSDDGGAEGYRRKIEAIRNEAGPNWLKVWAEMGGGNETQQPQVVHRNSSSIGV